MELIVVEVLGRHDVRPPTVVAAEENGCRRASGADREQPRGVRGIKPDVIAGDPDVLRAGVTELPAIEVLAVEQGLPALAGGNRSVPDRLNRQGVARAEESQDHADQEDTGDYQRRSHKRLLQVGDEEGHMAAVGSERPEHTMRNPSQQPGSLVRELMLRLIPRDQAVQFREYDDFSTYGAYHRPHSTFSGSRIPQWRHDR